MKNIPEKIYLQVDPDNEQPETFNELEYEITWCRDKLNDTDIEYVAVSGATVVSPSERCWRRLDEEKPSIGQLVLVWNNKFSAVIQATWMGTNFSVMGGYRGEIKFWMPRPKPPEG